MTDEEKKIVSVPPPPTDEIDGEWGDDDQTLVREAPVASSQPPAASSSKPPAASSSKPPAAAAPSNPPAAAPVPEAVTKSQPAPAPAALAGTAAAPISVPAKAAEASTPPEMKAAAPVTAEERGCAPSLGKPIYQWLNLQAAHDHACRADCRNTVQDSLHSMPCRALLFGQLAARSRSRKARVLALIRIGILRSKVEAGDPRAGGCIGKAPKNDGRVQAT